MYIKIFILQHIELMWSGDPLRQKLTPAEGPHRNKLTFKIISK